MYLLLLYDYLLYYHNGIYTYDQIFERYIFALVYNVIVMYIHQHFIDNIYIMQSFSYASYYWDNHQFSWFILYCKNAFIDNNLFFVLIFVVSFYLMMLLLCYNYAYVIWEGHHNLVVDSSKTLDQNLYNKRHIYHDTVVYYSSVENGVKAWSKILYPTGVG